MWVCGRCPNIGKDRNIDGHWKSDETEFAKVGVWCLEMLGTDVEELCPKMIFEKFTTTPLNLCAKSIAFLGKPKQEWVYHETSLYLLL